MKILLRYYQDEDRVYALDPVDGAPLRRIENPVVWCDNDDLGTGYEHPEGIYWDNLDSALEQLSGKHKIVFD